jgi:hypothetical protein
MIAAAVLGAFVAGVLLGALMQFQRIADYELRHAELQERNDRLTEAISQPTAAAPVVMPRTPIVVEPGSGWWDTKPVARG